MSGKTKILYTIAKYDPSAAIDDKKIVDVHEHYDLLKLLSEDGANKYNNILLSLVRYLIKYTEANPNKQSTMISEIKNAFMNVVFDNIEDADILYLVERVLVGDDIYYGSFVN